MKLHHTAALVLMGWFLMVPPVPLPAHRNLTDVYKQTPVSPDPNAPLNEWHRHGYFDSAAACEDRLKALKRPYAPGPSAADNYQCVYEGDPRLVK